MEQTAAQRLALLPGLRLDLQEALAGERFQLVDIGEERVGEAEHQGGGEVVALPHLLRPPQRHPRAEPVGALEGVHGPALVRLEPPEAPAHVVPQRGGSGGLGHQVDERGKALLHAHPDRLAVRSVQQPGVFRIGAGDLHTDFLDETGEFGPHDRGEFLGERPQGVIGVQRLYEVCHAMSPLLSAPGGGVRRWGKALPRTDRCGPSPRRR